MSKIDPQAIQNGDRLALSRALTVIENDDPQSLEIQADLFPHTGQSHIVGVTGAPGTGKSTLVNQLVKAFRQNKSETKPPKVAVIAVDPTSPFTGGALLGDRIRMADLSGDKGVFIRSMASRGALGGLAHNTAAFATILDAAGFDMIVIETVGAGQAEVDVAQLAHTVVVVEAPGMGDDIQSIKAGILEIADILVVNKADRPGADNTARTLKVMLDMAQNSSNLPAGKHGTSNSDHLFQDIYIKQETWKPPVHTITATEGKGIAGLAADIQAHRAYLQDTGVWQIKEAHRLRRDLDALIRDKLLQQWQQALDQEQFEGVLQDVIERKYSPIEAANLLVHDKTK